MTIFPISALQVVVADVARFARPDAPHMLTRAEFDAARVDAGWATAPSASAICKRIRRPWAGIVAASLSYSGAAFGRMASVKYRRDEMVMVTEDAIRAALRLVAALLPANRPLSPNAYNAARRMLAARDAKHWRHGGSVEATMPTADQIIAKAGSWRAALALAGVDAAPAIQGGVPPSVVIYWHLRRYGTVPALHAAERFAKELGISMGRDRPLRWARSVEAARAMLELHEDVAPPAEWLEADSRFARKRRSWEIDDLLDALADVLLALPVGARVAQRDLLAISRGNRRVPSPSVVMNRAGEAGMTVEQVWAESARRAAARRRTSDRQPTA